MFQVVLFGPERPVDGISDATVRRKTESGNVFVDVLGWACRVLVRGPAARRQRRRHEQPNTNSDGGTLNVENRRRLHSLGGMRRLIRMAARRLHRCELHDFHASAVGIVGIEAVFAVAPDFGAVECLQTMRAQLSRGGLGVFDAERKMILHAEFLVICVGRNVQHVLDPIVAVRHLNFIPILAVILEATVPIEAKAKNIAIEVVFRRYVPLQRIPREACDC